MKYISLIALAIAITALGIVLYQTTNDVQVSNLAGAVLYSDATNSSSSIPTTATTTNPVLSADPDRENAIVCNNSAYAVFLHPKGQATTTGVVVHEGIPLSPIGFTTSTANVCREFPGFRGYLFGIAGTEGSVTVSSW